MSDTRTLVFIYKVDELTLLSRKLVANSVSQFPQSRMALLSQLFDRITFQAEFNDLKQEDLVNIDDMDYVGLQKTRRIFPKYKKLREIYDAISDETRENDHFISYELMNRCGMEGKTDEIRRVLLTYQNDIDQGWLGVKDYLKLVKERLCCTNKHVNVVLCEDGVAHGAAQLLVSGCSSEIPFENIYSTATEPIDYVLEKIKRRFEDMSVLLIHAMDPQTVLAAEKLEIIVSESNCYQKRDSIYIDYKSLLHSFKCYYINCIK